MLAGSFSLNWAALLAIMCALLVVGAIAFVWAIRVQRSRRIRLGVFVERDIDPPAGRADEADTEVRPPPG